MSRYCIRHEPQRCIACRACELHCQSSHGLSPDVKPGVLLVEDTAGPSGEERCHVAFRPCFHCENPWCVAVCPTRAIVTDPQDGLVRIDAAKCVGCRACVEACPWGVPQYDATTGKAVKCDGCADRVRAGSLPACVAACTTHALSFSVPNAVVRRVRQDYARSKLVKRIMTTALNIQEERNSP
ncbi:MAG: 4Fe-4S dicluster domain-containing protein [Thermodesulfobacteriota bacterium]